jgi:hypothetical protein
MKLLAQWTCAWINANDCFDPLLVDAAGIDLSRVLCIRCGSRYKTLNAVEQVFKATDILLRHGEFNLVIADLSRVAERLIRKVPLTTWHRFSRAAERTSTTLVFLTSVPVAQSCANMKLQIVQGSGLWAALNEFSHPAHSADLSHTQIIFGIETNCEILREKLRKPIQGVNAKIPPFSKRA